MLYFAYGSNLSKAAMRRRAPQAKPLIAALLPDHMLTFESNEPSGAPPAFFANVRPHLNSFVPGAVYEVEAAALAALDAYEDVERGVYERVEFLVRRADGKRTVAKGYRMPLAPGMRLRGGRPSNVQLRQIYAGYADWGLDLGVLRATMRWIPSTRSLVVASAL